MLTPFRPLTAQSPCPLCASDAATVLALRDGKTREPLTSIACSNCGLGRIDPMPTTEALEQWYTHAYRQDYKAAVEPQRRHVLRAARHAAHRWRWLRAHLPAPLAPTARTLDVGASSGEFVGIGKLLGYAPTGFEPHKGYAGFGVREFGVDVRQGTLEANLAGVGAEKFDVISMFHVLEHVPDPVATLRTLASLLSDDGVVFIEVPDAAKACSPHYMFFRAHCLYFSLDSLRTCFQAAGLEVFADNGGGAEEIRMLARKPRAAAHAPQFTTNEALVSAHKKRRWLPYLWGQATSLAPLAKLRRRAEEKRTAHALQGSATALLQRAMRDAALTD